MDAATATVICTAILGVVGIQVTRYYSKHSKQLADDQMMKELFTEFNHRYDELNDSLEIIYNEYSTIEKLNSADDAEELKNKVIDFFNLCAEEYYWYYHKKRIDPIVWKSWSDGMNFWYKNTPSIKAMWQREVDNGGLTSYYITDRKGFFL